MASRHGLRCFLSRAARWRGGHNGLIALLLIAALLGGLRLWPHPSLRHAFPQSSAVVDDHGHLLRLTLASDGQYRLWVPYAKISPQLVQATLLHEDRWYWWHPGFNPWGLLRGAWMTYIRHRHPQGGSTVTMQLVRLMSGLDTRSPLGKLKQVLLAVHLELFHSKRQILTAYLNDAPYGGNVVGADTASRVYFGKPADELNLPEALTLAVLPQNPSRRAHIRTKAGDTIMAPRLAKARNRLYRNWLRHHPADRKWRAAFAMPLALHGTAQLPFAAPHAVDQLMAQANARGHPLPTHVALTIDSGLQRLLERQIRDYVRQHDNAGIHNAAALLVDSRSMGIKAMVGSAGFSNRHILGQVNGTRAPRSPGSTLKPFIYALGFDQGVITPASILRDVPTSFGSYTPENFDERFQGPLTAAQALIRSRNIPAVFVDSRLHHPDLYALLKTAGVKHLASRRHYGLSLVLGGGDITMQELAGLYAMLLNDGRLKPLRLRKGEPQVAGQRLISAAASFMTLDILAHNPRPGDAFGAKADPLPAFWKTGTSWAFHDAWTAGGFGPYVLVVWVGNFDSTPNPAFVGIQAAAPLFFRIHDAIQAAHPDWHAAPRILPKPLKRVQICLATGMLPSRWCPERGRSWFIPGVSPIKVGQVYRPVVIDDTTGQPACPPYIGKQTHIEVFQYWPSDLAAVFANMGMAIKVPPRNSNCVGAGQPDSEPPRITSPRQGSAYVWRAGHQADNAISLAATDDAAVSTQYWFIDHAYIGHTAPGRPLAWSPNKPGAYQVHVVDDHGQGAARHLKVAPNH